MSNGLARAFAECDAKYKASVMFATWGHLDGKIGVRYECTFLFMNGECGDYALISSEFKGLSGGPLLNEILNDFMYQHINSGKVKMGEIWQFDGYYKIPVTDGAKKHFYGKLTKMKAVKS